MNDRCGRTIDYMRISVTDRCNLRCRYCMPEEGTSLFTHEELLTLEEILEICRWGAKLGISRIKLTGGEPLIRKNIIWLVKQIRTIPGIEDVTMTSNGILLKDYAKALKEAGLSSVNISLDTFSPSRFLEITRRNAYRQVREGIEAAGKAGLQVKLNCAVMEDFSLSEAEAFAAYSVEHQVPVRFIEMMPIGEGRAFSSVENDSLLAHLTTKYPDIHPLGTAMGNGPAVYYSFEKNRGCIGFISAVNHRFCHQCNRVRLTSDGYLKMCLAQPDGISLRDLLRQGVSEQVILEEMKQVIGNKPEGHQFGLEHGKIIETNMNRIGG